MHRFVFLAIAMAFTSCNAATRDFSPIQADSLLKAEAGDSSFRLIDVRTPEEFASGHIKGATMVDFKAPDFVEKISVYPRNAKILIYCRSGHRSGLALQRMEAMGFADVQHIVGGINGWSSQGLPVER